MEKLPAELYSTIFSLACTDDGTTGCALSLVSRAVHRESAPYKWQCLAISGPKQATKFVQRLKKLKGAAPPPIHHLFVSTHCACSAVDNDDESFGWRSLQDTIFQAAAPTLRTLTFVTFDAPRPSAIYIARLLTVSFPNLVELSIRGRWDPIHRITESPEALKAAVRTEDIAALSASTNRPQLRRLHVASQHSMYLDLTHDLVRTIAPSLTHLRLSILDRRSARSISRLIHAELAACGTVSVQLPLNWLVLDEPISVADAVTWPPFLPRELVLLAVQSPPPPQETFTNMFDSLLTINILKALEREARDLFMFIPLHRVRRYEYTDAKADWLDRIADGVGCWGERPDEGGNAEELKPMLGKCRCSESATGLRRSTSKLSKLFQMMKQRYTQ